MGELDMPHRCLLRKKDLLPTGGSSFKELVKRGARYVVIDKSAPSIHSLHTSPRIFERTELVPNRSVPFGPPPGREILTTPALAVNCARSDERPG